MTAPCPAVPPSAPFGMLRVRWAVDGDGGGADGDGDDDDDGLGGMRILPSITPHHVSVCVEDSVALIRCSCRVRVRSELVNHCLALGVC